MQHLRGINLQDPARRHIACCHSYGEQPKSRSQQRERVIQRHSDQHHRPHGSQIRVGAQLLTIVGVVAQARLYGLYADGRPQVLVRAEDFGMRPLYPGVQSAYFIGPILFVSTAMSS